MTFFLVIDLVLRIFPFFSHIFRMFTMLNVVYDHFLTRKPPFFTLFILSRTSDNTASQNIGGDQCMGRPPPQIFGGPSPSPPYVSAPAGLAQCAAYIRLGLDFHGRLNGFPAYLYVLTFTLSSLELNHALSRLTSCLFRTSLWHLSTTLSLKTLLF